MKGMTETERDWEQRARAAEAEVDRLQRQNKGWDFSSVAEVVNRLSGNMPASLSTGHGFSDIKVEARWIAEQCTDALAEDIALAMTFWFEDANW